MDLKTFWETYTLGVWADIVTFVGLLFAIYQIMKTRNMVKKALKKASVEALNSEIKRKTQKKGIAASEEDPEKKYSKCPSCGGKIKLLYNHMIEDSGEDASLLGYEKRCACKNIKCKWVSSEWIPVGVDFNPIEVRKINDFTFFHGGESSTSQFDTKDL